MFIALVLLNVVHPGRLMPGKESDLPSRKSRKEMGKKNVRGRAMGGSALPMYTPAGQSNSVVSNGRKDAAGNQVTDT